MAKAKTAEVELVYERCCGLDVHKDLIVACFRDGSIKTTREFGAMSKDLRELAQWLIDGRCEMTAMESTGPYWKPVYNILELLGLDLMVVNAHHMKNLPGRKTDAKDADWIARLLAQGLLNPSFIPDREQRELRDVTRYRKSLTDERAREINRLGKILEGANIKITSVVTDVLGSSSRKLLNTAMEGGVLNGETINDLVGKHMPGKQDILADAMDGVLSKAQKFLIRKIFDHIDDMARRIAELDDFIESEMDKYDKAIERISELPGIGFRSAQTILSEIGLDMGRFPTAGHLSVWAGLSPGNNISAGKSKGGKTIKGNKTLKATLVQCAQVASRMKGTFYSAQFDRLVVRRGKNRAKTAVAHSMMITIWHMLKNETEFYELGSDYYNRFNAQKKISMYLKKLKDLGWTEPIPANA